MPKRIPAKLNYRRQPGHHRSGPSSLDNRRCRARHLACHQMPFPTVPQSSRQARTERLKLAQRGADPSPIEKAERHRESERRKEEAAGAKERQRREQAIAKAQAALEKAEREHDTRASAIAAERASVEKRSQAEDARWEKQKQKLHLALRRARE